MNLLAFVTGEPITSAIVWLIGLGLIFWLLWWLIDYLALPAPFNKVARVLLAVAAVVLLIRVIMRITGAGI